MTPESFAAATDLFSEPAFLLTRNGAVLGVNVAAARQLGAPPDAIQGRALADFVTSPADAWADYLRSCARSKQKVPGAVTLRDAAGQAVAFRADGFLLQPAER